jgi:type IV pilus assembly protein PilA
MRQMLKNKLKEQKGLTLIELLAVIVILGIISAIAIPSIMGLIDNSKKDAHIANAQQMINSAKLAVAGDDTYTSSGFITLLDLETEGYLEEMTDPDKTTAGYSKTDSKVYINKKTSGDGYTYKVYLTNGEKTVGTSIAAAGATKSANAVDENDLKRSIIKE